ncbi:aromatic ring-hydroxylating dioxygenase subunit alpha [Marinobacterium iners]|uniref:Vanillate O-demethylase monooxygenase subunit n=1 Tax=Marinobacterium iners DSM 11526 TaxID=1122198 RepID=A0A1H4D960_9GAMM|nr:aromatic ring-hydroxylating dioxygenase subunit alpha [Marinobacterium iners]SEA69295.1 vanillate O-demethylase monooxygenase subunit [Marinobacterium iners DSM 11526]
MELINKKDTSFLKNTWYVAALTTEIDADTMLSRKIIGETLLFYRKQNGEVTAIRDRCPHRFAPLSKGVRDGDEITCSYHGLKFNSDGQCTHSSHGSGKIPKACKVRSFPVEERDGFIWIWMGNQEKADTTQIMDCSILNRKPESAVGYIYMYNKCNYQLLTDNIMDLSHIDHLHGPLINTNGKLSPLLPKVEENGSVVSVRWDWLAEPAMQLLAVHLERPEDQANQFFQVNWHAPSNMHLQVAAVQDSMDYENDGRMLYDYHIMTPESEFSTHYFFASARNYLEDDAEYNAAKMAGMKQAFVEEDKPMIEAQQQEMGEAGFWELNPILLSSDAGGIRVRRKLAELLEIESA